MIKTSLFAFAALAQSTYFSDAESYLYDSFDQVYNFAGQLQADYLPGVTFGARCPTHDVVHDFDAEAYFGNWYEGAVTKNFKKKLHEGECTYAIYGANEDGTISVDNSDQLGSAGAFEPRNHVTGYAKPKDDSGDARLVVHLTPAPVPGPYDVLKTDYTSYALIYSCQDFFVAKFESAWLLTREKTPVLEPLVDQAKYTFSKVGLDFD